MVRGEGKIGSHLLESNDCKLQLLIVTYMGNKTLYNTSHHFVLVLPFPLLLALVNAQDSHIFYVLF